jgi:hypothetical protein
MQKTQQTVIHALAVFELASEQSHTNALSVWLLGSTAVITAHIQQIKFRH